VPLLPTYVIGSTLLTTFALLVWIEGVFGFGGGPSYWKLLAWAVSPILPITLFQLTKTYRALSAGFTISDLRLALRTWRKERMDELTFEIGGRRDESRWARWLRHVPIICGGTFFVHALKSMRSVHISDPLVLKGLLLTGGAALLLMTGLGVPIFPPKLQRFAAGRLRGWLWNSKLGEWLAARLTPRHRALASVEFRPTEVALGIAVEDLFAALPSVYRDDLRGLPEIIRRLTDHAASLRDEVARLEPMTGSNENAGAAEVQRLFESAKMDLADTVSALERIRLDLLRLHGGLTDLRPITTSLDAARQIADDIRRLDDAQSEVSGRRAQFLFER
jgi:eukaryotic-like serine/threonine-protein kinase